MKTNKKFFLKLYGLLLNIVLFLILLTVITIYINKVNDDIKLVLGKTVLILLLCYLLIMILTGTLGLLMLRSYKKYQKYTFSNLIFSLVIDMVCLFTAVYAFVVFISIKEKPIILLIYDGILIIYFIGLIIKGLIIKKEEYDKDGQIT